jgi:DNA-binding transcriptional LysR family regulator
MKSIDFNLLPALDALLAEGSVSRAAERMHLSTPAMSHKLARLREQTGDPLLVRAGRALSLTPRAIELREPVRRLVEEARALLSSSEDASVARVEREFVVRSPDGIAIIYGAALTIALQKAMPSASLRFVPESEREASALREGQIDLDIGLVRDRGPEVLTDRLFEQHYVGAVRKGHALLSARITLPRFLAQQHVAVTQRGRVEEPLDVAVRAAGRSRRVVLTVPSAYGALVAAARSDLVACVPVRVARGVDGSLGLRTFALPLVLPTDVIVQAWHPRLQADAAHRCLRQTVKAVLAMPVSTTLSAPLIGR